MTYFKIFMTHEFIKRQEDGSERADGGWRFVIPAEKVKVSEQPVLLLDFAGYITDADLVPTGVVLDSAAVDSPRRLVLQCGEEAVFYARTLSDSVDGRHGTYKVKITVKVISAADAPRDEVTFVKGSG